LEKLTTCRCAFRQQANPVQQLIEWKMYRLRPQEGQDTDTKIEPGNPETTTPKDGRSDRQANHYEY
jgi:hypothetical protein